MQSAVELVRTLNSKQFKTFKEVKKFIDKNLPEGFSAIYEGRSVIYIRYEKNDNYRMRMQIEKTGWQYKKEERYYDACWDRNFGINKWHSHSETFTQHITFNDLKLVNERYPKYQRPEASDFERMKNALNEIKYYNRQLQQEHNNFQKNLLKLQEQYQWCVEYYTDNISNNQKIVNTLLNR